MAFNFGKKNIETPHCDVSTFICYLVSVIFYLKNPRDANPFPRLGAGSLDVFNRLRYRFAEDSVACLGDEEVVFDADAAEVLE